jgi:hypothetical protein
MKLNFCTLFDSNYIARGLALYDSLLKHSRNFHLYIFAFDDKAFTVLKGMKLKHATVIALSEFEDEELLKIKPTRSRGEYCWTCTSSTILYAIKKYNLDNVTYLDADMLFYNNPQILIDEMGDDSVMITEHRYTAEYDQSKISGKYCVQFMFFKNDERGMRVLNWWRERCLEWCYNRVEDGKFGDQKYLDVWTSDFPGVHELRHLGGGVAPWNIQQYEFKKDVDRWLLRTKGSGDYMELVFIHFHDLVFFKDGFVRLSKYPISSIVQREFYTPYLKQLKDWGRKVSVIDPSINPNAARDTAERNYSLRYKFAAYRKALSKFSVKELLKTREELRDHPYIELNTIE